MTAPVAERSPDRPRPWHLSELLLGPPGVPNEDGPDARQVTNLLAADSARETASSRALRVRLRMARRDLARRVARWIKLHPELGIAARSGNLRGTFSSYRRLLVGRFRHRPVGGARYVSTVSIDARLSVASVHRPLLLDAIGLRDEPEGSSNMVSVVDADDGMLAVRGPAGDVETVDPPVDVARFSPMSFRRHPPDTGVLLLAQLLTVNSADHTRVAAAQRARGVFCDGTANDAFRERGRCIAQLGCAGVPLIGDVTPLEAAVVGADLAQVITTATAADIMDDRRRELLSLRVRRAAFARHTPAGWWSTIGDRIGVEVDARPAVSVLLPSNRPSDVVEAARSVARQTGVVVQLVVGLHGSHMPADLDSQLAKAFPGDLVIRRCDDRLNLGQVLNRLTEAATCDLVSKWDDDDWYAPEHLSDLVRAMEFSGAGLVGKAAEFVYLEAIDVTVQRFADNSERWSSTVAGGALMLRRDDLVETPWAEVPRRVDRRLIEDLEAAGRRTFRTHGFGYVLRRRQRKQASHTWTVGDAYFLDQSVDQRAGLDLAFAGCSAGVDW